VSTVILAGTTREADAYRMENGPRFANYNPTVAQVRQATTIVELPSFAKRLDRFALQQARDNNLNFGRGVDYIRPQDWVWPKPKPAEPEEVEVVDETATASLYEIDLTDETVLEELKTQLNKVGLTLKKLPAKKQDAPVVDAPVEF